MKPFRSMPPTITLLHGTDREQQTKEQFLRLFDLYPLNKWRYTEQVQIDERAIPHSHPVLTLHTRHVDDDEQLLGTYIHEQLHWFCVLVEKSDSAYQAMNEFQEIYPELPVAPPEGCGSAISNYLHVLVNTLEYVGLCELFGRDKARQVLTRKTYYTKIYQLVLEDQQHLMEVIARNALLPPERPPEKKVFIEVTR